VAVAYARGKRQSAALPEAHTDLGHMPAFRMLAGHAFAGVTHRIPVSLRTRPGHLLLAARLYPLIRQGAVAQPPRLSPACTMLGHGRAAGLRQRCRNGKVRRSR
jgi:hypothetical protein